MKIVCVCVVLCFLFSTCVAQASLADAQRACAPINNPALVAACDAYNDAAAAYTRCVTDAQASGTTTGTSEVNQYVNLCQLISGVNVPPNSLPPTTTSTLVVPGGEVAGNNYCATITANTVNGRKTTGGDDFAVTSTCGTATVTDNKNGLYSVCYTLQGPSCSTSKTFTCTIAATLAGGSAISGSTATVAGSCASNGTNGDPHFSTPVRGTYTYQGQGDYYLNILGNTLLQVRQGPCGGVGITCNTGLAIKTDDGTRVEFFGPSTIRVNNVTQYINPLPLNTQVALGAEINALQLSTYTIEFYFTGGAVTVNIYTYTSGNGPAFYLDVQTYGARINSGGLYATAGRNGEVWGADVTSVTAYGNSWRTLNEADSIFYYNNSVPYYVLNPNGAPQNYNCSGITALANTSCSALNSTSPLVQYCSKWIPDSATYYQNCQCDVTNTGLTVWAQSILNNYLRMCSDNCFGCVIPNLPTCSLTSYANVTSPANALTLQTVRIQAKDLLGNNRQTGGDTFTITAVGPQSLPFGAVTYTSGGVYTARYAASTDGNYTFSILYGGLPINGSPYSVQIIN